MPATNSGSLYVWIPNWHGADGFQHYRDRDPIWIKNYVRLLFKDEYLRLSSHLRGVLHGIWLAYASSNRRLAGDTRSLSSRLAIRVTSRDIESLSHAGFIEIIASDVLAKRLQDASDPLALARAGAEKETEVEKETFPPTVSNTPEPVPAPEAREGGWEPDKDIDFDTPDDPNGAGAGTGDFERIDPHAILRAAGGGNP